MKDTNENLLLPMDDQPAKPVYINEQHNHNCQQFYGPVTGCVFAMPGATVNQYPNGTAQAASSSQKNSVEETQPATRNPQLIIDYVMRLHPSHISPEWQDRYLPLWKEILKLSAVAEEIYNPGKQMDNSDSKLGLRKAEFNRKLVANILCMMKLKKVFNTDIDKELKNTLEGKYNDSVRTELGKIPESKEIKTEIEKLIIP